MASYSSDRRSLLKIIGAVGATCAYPFSSDELFGQTSPAPPTDRAVRFFNQDDFATISRIAELIIPKTDTAGAVEAGVPEYIDLVISRNTDRQLVMADGLRWLDAQARKAAGKPFVDLSERRQLAILEPLCEAADAKDLRARNVQFFALMKSLTADGYYTSQIGLLKELGYTGNQALASFPECIHEH